MPSILGISAFYHDSAAAVVCDGKIVAAAQEERFTRVKHDSVFPAHAIAYCLSEAGLKPEALGAVVFYDKPILKFERLLETYLAFSPRGFRSFTAAIPVWLKQKLFLTREIDNGLGKNYAGPIYFTAHHESHAAAAFFPSPFNDAAIITMDGVGEWTTTSWGEGTGNRINLKEEIRFPHSLGLLYSAFTYYTGFRVNSGEYKLMGLAPYGKPIFADLIMENIIDLKDDGSFWLNQRYFNYCAGLTMTSKSFHDLMGGPPRKPEEPVTQRVMDISASIQHVTEEVVLRIARHVHGKTGKEYLCLGGGVALNCVANGRLLKEGLFKDIWIQPAAGDAGAAAGCALYAWHQILGNRRIPAQAGLNDSPCLGPSYGADYIKSCLTRFGAVFRQFDEDELCSKVAELLDSGRVVGRFAGRMEFGPRALGNRSILADARNPEMQSKLNLKVKFRESFRPFAPSCLEEMAGEYFEMDRPSPYMLFVVPVKEAIRVPVSEDESKLSGMDKLRVVRSRIPAVTHVDNTARVQTVNRESSPGFYKLIKAFEERTGCGLVVNTSFNIRGEPIVCTPEDAYRCFMLTGIDALAIEGFLCLKDEQPAWGGVDDYMSRFKPD